MIKAKYNAHQLCCCCTRQQLMPDVSPEEELWVGGYTVPENFYAMCQDRRIRLHVSAVQRVMPDGSMQLADGTSTAPTELIVAATGWGRDQKRFDWLPPEVADATEEDGLYLYRHMLLPELEGLVWIGANVSTLSQSLTANVQAVWLLQLLEGRHSLPPKQQMQAEIEEMKLWKRRVIPFQHDRGATIMMHQLYYHDELLRDLGQSHQLKQNRWLELWQPYLPVDYQSVVEQLPAAPGAHGERIGHADGSGYLVITYGCLLLFLLTSMLILACTVVVCTVAAYTSSCHL